MKGKMAMRKLSHILLVVLLVSAFSVRAFAQDESPSKYPNALQRAQAMAFLFSLSGAGAFGIYGPSANGAADDRVIAHTGLRYSLSQELAIRALFSFFLWNNGDDNAKANESDFGIGVALLYNLPVLYSIAPYLGGGIGFDAYSYENTNDGIAKGDDQHQQSPTYGPQSNTSIGLTGLAGFDWYFTDGIALGAEFSLGFYTTSITYKNQDGTETDGGSPSGFGISPGGGTNIHLVVNF
jgi:hypothetical protein